MSPLALISPLELTYPNEPVALLIDSLISLINPNEAVTSEGLAFPSAVDWAVAALVTAVFAVP